MTVYLIEQKEKREYITSNFERQYRLRVLFKLAKYIEIIFIYDRQAEAWAQKFFDSDLPYFDSHQRERSILIWEQYDAARAVKSSGEFQGISAWVPAESHFHPFLEGISAIFLVSFLF